MDLVIISSVINTCSAPLSYYPIRSVFDKHQRYAQTLQTIDSLSKIPNKKIYFVECSDIPEFEVDIKKRVDFYKNIYKGNEAIIDGPHKGLGEAVSLLSVDGRDYENIYKISGRYYLTDEFDYSLWDNENTLFWVDEKNGWRLTVFYKINKKQFTKWLEILTRMKGDNEPRAIEQMMMGIRDFNKINKIGIEGFTAGGGLVKF